MLSAAERPYHHGNLKSALIAAALYRLAGENSEALSLRELAHDCGVSTNAPYRHFSSKEELLCEVAEHGFAELAKTLEAPHADGPVRQFRELSQRFSDFATQHRGLFAVMASAGHRAHASGGTTPGELDPAGPNQKHCFNLLADSVRIVMDEVVVDENVRQSAVVAWCMLCGYASLEPGASFPLSELKQPLDAKDAAKIMARGLKR